MGDLVWTSAVDLARMIATKEISPVEVTRAFLDRVAALDGTLKSFITVSGESALDAARAAEADLVAGRLQGPLHGVPLGLKDLFNTAGGRATCGSKILAESVPAADATVVRRLRAAGAIVLGKLNMHEFAYGPEGLNEHYGHARNPWDAQQTRVTGGSSSGSGAAVAAALVPVALGSGTRGSHCLSAAPWAVPRVQTPHRSASPAGVPPPPRARGVPGHSGGGWTGWGKGGDGGGTAGSGWAGGRATIPPIRRPASCPSRITPLRSPATSRACGWACCGRSSWMARPPRSGRPSRAPRARSKDSGRSWTRSGWRASGTWRPLRSRSWRARRF